MPGKSKSSGKPRFVDGFIHKSTIGRGNFGVVSIVKCKADGVRYVMKKIAFTGKKQSDRDASLAEVWSVLPCVCVRALERGASVCIVITHACRCVGVNETGGPAEGRCPP